MKLYFVPINKPIHFHPRDFILPLKGTSKHMVMWELVVTKSLNNGIIHEPSPTDYFHILTPTCG